MSARDPAESSAPLSATYVLHGRRLRVGVALSDTPRFSDPLWALTSATTQRHQRGLTLNFATVPEGYRPALKSLIYTALSGPLPASEQRKALPSVATLFYDARAFLLWLDNTHRDTALSDVSAEILLTYQRHLMAEQRAPTRRHSLRAAVAFFWRYRKGLDEHDALKLNPRPLLGWHERRGQRGENSTPRIPEPVHSRLLVWALRFVDDFADDIINAIGRWAQLREPPASPRNPYGASRQVVVEYLRSSEHVRRPIPGINNQPNYLAIARLLGLDPQTVRQHSSLIETAVSTLGVSEYSYLDVSISGLLDGLPWADGISVRTDDDYSLTVLTQALQAACYVVVAFLSGMRDGEIKHLRPGSCTVEADQQGHPYRWKVSSLAFKGEDSELGVPAVWTISASGARAISVMERVHRAAAHGSVDWIFAPIPVGPGAGSSGRTGNLSLTSAATNHQLNRLISWVNSYCENRGRTDTIPNVEGAPWRLSTRQFRRTLAWYIARRPGGSIAGAIAYRHHSIQMFEGYAGTSDSGFRAEVEAEQAMAIGENLLAMIDQHEHHGLVGPAAEDAERRLTRMAERSEFTGTVTTDRHRFQRLLKVQGPAVYPGKYVTCVYTPSRALCRPSDGTSGIPDQTTCKPLACSNVALTRENIEMWRGELEQIDRDLKGPPPLPPAVAELLKQRSLQIHDFLERHETKL